MSVTFGVIGCGGISRFHFSGLAKAKANVRWVCDLSEDLARPWATQLGAKLTRDYRQILSDPAVQAVAVTTVSAAHKEICLAAIEAHKAVICEKTLAENAPDALEIVQAAARKGTILYTSYMKRFIPAVQKAKELLPALGRVLSAHIRAHQCWGDLWEQAPASGFFHAPPGGKSEVRARYGGGILVCGGSHILDLVLHLVGRPARLAAFATTPEGMDIDLQATVLMETPNGRVLFEALSHPLTRIGFLRDGWDERVEITGTRGRLELFSAAWNEVEHKASLLVHYDNATGQATEYRFAPESPFDRAVALFCDNIERGVQGNQSALTGYEVDNLIAHIQRSSRTGQVVQVEWQA